MIELLLKRFNPMGIIIGVGAIVLGLSIANIYTGIHTFTQIQELNTRSQLAGDSTSIQRQINEIKHQNKQLAAWLSSNNQDNQHASFQEMVLSAAKKSGIKTITTLSSLTIGDNDEFTERYKVAISGSYTRIMRFVNKLELGTLPVRITQLDIEKKGENSLSCDLTVGILNTGSQDS